MFQQLSRIMVGLRKHYLCDLLRVGGGSNPYCRFRLDRCQRRVFARTKLGRGGIEIFGVPKYSDLRTPENEGL